MQCTGIRVLVPYPSQFNPDAHMKIDAVDASMGYPAAVAAIAVDAATHQVMQG